MYIRSVKTRGLSKDKVYLNYKLVQSVRVDGEPRQIILLSLGNLAGLIRYYISKKSLKNILNNGIDIEIFDKLSALEGRKFYTIFHLKFALNKTIGKQAQEKYLSIISSHCDVFKKNCKLLARRIV